ncbi:low temperature requirement protein LtrA [Labedaea rhizosphaerae]|uniref:Low temperature requirement protein LtrA n=2 Tax=Labedaea rhizosphaerae TaxID=598644 RepID=A0A4R6RRU6_LABRH|nr:low temperature requirement protein LtrA [Labedaea rhizosphaerae]
MTARNPDEEHRTATTLELFFDLCFVVAVSLAATQLHHALAEGHAGHGLAGYLPVFFAIWWAWMNFTWFASAYDTDDLPYRLTTLVQIAGVLVLAAGVPNAFEGDFRVIVGAYIVMRLAMVGQWLRAAHADPPRRACSLRYAAGITVVQVAWVVWLWLPAPMVFFVLFALAEIAVPIWAERKSPTRWHAEHIAERYGLFTLIVLGESVLAATTATQSAFGAGHDVAKLLTLSLAGLVIVFSMWWMYFDQPSPQQLLNSLRTSMVWGYSHLLVFASAAAVGAGLQVAVDYDTGEAHPPQLLAGYAIAIPVAVYVLMVWALQVRPTLPMPVSTAYPVTVVLLLLTPFTGAPVHVAAVLVALLVAVTVFARGRAF